MNVNLRSLQDSTMGGLDTLYIYGGGPGAVQGLLRLLEILDSFSATERGWGSQEPWIILFFIYIVAFLYSFL